MLLIGVHLTYCSRKPGAQRVPLKVRAAVSHPDLNVLQWLVACVQTKIRWIDKIFSGLRSGFLFFNSRVLQSSIYTFYRNIWRGVPKNVNKRIIQKCDEMWRFWTGFNRTRHWTISSLSHMFCPLFTPLEIFWPKFCLQIFLMSTVVLIVVHRVVRCATLKWTVVCLRSLSGKGFQKLPDIVMYFFDVLLTVRFIIIFVNDQLDPQFFFVYLCIPILYMFRATRCSSSGESIVSIRPLVYVTVCKWPCGVQV